MNGSLRLAVTGNPVIHSLSPVIFRNFFRKHSVEGFYSRIAADSIDEVLRCAEIISLTGINVTSPFKEEAYRISGIKNRTADFLKASNTLCFRENTVTADNTDPLGVAGPVQKRFPDPSNLKAVVIGAGGAGVAACYALSSNGFRTVMVNRTVEKAEKRISGIKNCSAEALDNIDDAVKGASLVIHTLPVPDCFFDPSVLMKDAVLFDANYKYSPMKKIASERGLGYIDGREWLFAQAEAAYKIFTGCGNKGELISSGESSADDADDFFSYAPYPDNISLIGFMGSGKTATGKKLSEVTGYEFADTDYLIEKKAGLSIPVIFREKGETYFRNMERDVVIELLADRRRKIISCGGGVVGDSLIRKELGKRSIPVWLLSSPETSLSRITDNSRPLLETPSRYEKAVSLFNERIDLYGAVSQLIINTEKRDAEKTAGRIYEEICELL